jgi:hypothetical protein
MMKEQMKALLHENTYAADETGKVIPIDSQNAIVKTAMDMLNQILAEGFKSQEEEAFFLRASLPLHISMSAFISRKREESYPHWISGDTSTTFGRSSLRWTGTKAEAVEIIYELVHVGVINNGQATIMQVAKWFEREFQIELGNVSKTFQDIRNRRKETTSFALKMDKALRQYIEQLDEEDLEKHNHSKRA